MSQAQTQPDGSGQSRSEVAKTTIGPYEVLSRLALGGMAELFLARRDGIEGFQKLVVIKRILPQYATNPEFVEMFLREARLAAALEHPNIVQVFDIGKSGDDYYFAMAYLHGKDALAILRELSRTHRTLPIELAIAIASGIAAGLHHAHEQVGFDGKPLEIVHRDVSPANAIVTFDGTVKLVDFGIAKAAAQMNQTRAGVRKGKAAYMSPEQCRGDPLDRRTDIWSLGVVLYELLTLTRLFRADNDLAIMHRITSMDAPSPGVLCPDLSPTLEAIVLRCLRRDRNERYATAALLLRDLETCAHELGLRPSASGLAEFLRGLFGTQPLPWTPTNPLVQAPVTSSIEVGAEPIAAPSGGSDATRDLGNTPPPRAETRIAPRTAPYPSASPRSVHAVAGMTDDDAVPRRSPLALVLGVGGLCLAAAAAWALWPRDGVPTPTVATEAIATSTPAPDRGAEIEQWLAQVNEDDAATNPVAQRHALLAKLRTTTAASRIDESLQVRLDLVQAPAAARPCETFATALERAAQDRTRFAVALANANAPDPAVHPAAGRAPDRPCDGLAARLLELRAGAPTVALTEDAAKPAVTRPRKRPAIEPGTEVTKPGTKPVVPPAPEPAKLDDELRPFRKP